MDVEIYQDWMGGGNISGLDWRLKYIKVGLEVEILGLDWRLKYIRIGLEVKIYQGWIGG